ncbi:MFS transporter [Parascardovia denticolens]|uniref:MFS transporter n=1 Tax=Parascardovia denticolens TaxID=78258 RepID=UPI00248D5377|nr:MFS transporter [Parascardovia denticolens]
MEQGVEQVDRKDRIDQVGQRVETEPGKSGRGIFALSFGAFAYGAAEFVMMGVLTQVAASTHVSIPMAGHYISFMIIALVGDLIAASAPNFALLLAGRFISGLPHGAAFFGTATIAAQRLAASGKEARSVSLMVTGQTVANMVGVPLGTLLGEKVSWRLAFAILALWAAATVVLMLAWIPQLKPIPDAGLKGQFRFLKSPRAWLVLGAVLFGNTGIFCWWSYVSPWLTHVGTYSSAAVPALMALAGFGMVLGGLTAGRVSDHWVPGGTAALGQLLATATLLVIFFDKGSRPTSALLTFILAFGMFFVSAPQQYLMVKVSEGGGEMLGAALTQIAFNLGNSLGSIIGGWALMAAFMDYHSIALAGAPIDLVAVILLGVFSARYEKHKRLPPIRGVEEV